MLGPRSWRNFDALLLGATLLLNAFGVAMIHSATKGTPGLQGFALRQGIFMLVGLALMLMATMVDYHLLEVFAKPLYLLSLALLAGVLILGEITHGSRRWFDLGPILLQPSEIAKICLIVVLAKYLADRPGDRFWNFLSSLALMALPAFLIYLEPDLGTAVALLFIWLVMVVMAGARMWHLGLLGTGGVMATPLIWLSLRDYMRQRLLLFLNPQLDPGARYNLDQALISIGSGGWLGKGFGHGSQSQLHFLRVRHTDFIFSVVGEELGFVGASILILLLLFVLLRTLRAAYLARDDFGRLIVCGVMALLFFQSFINIGMNLGLLPTTGIPLPFMSYGGSSLVSLWAAQGLVQNVLMRRKKLEFD